MTEKQVKADLYLLLEEYNSYDDFNTFMLQLIEMYKANIDKKTLISLLTSIYGELEDEEWEKEDLLGCILDCMTDWASWKEETKEYEFAEYWREK